MDCTLSVQAGDDVLACSPGETVSLQAEASEASLLDVRWSPGELVADSTSLATTATTDQSTTFRVTVRSILPENLIVNGDFNMGDFGFGSDYSYANSTASLGLLSKENQYAVGDNPLDWHRSFAPCGDHTGGGNMMIINGSGRPNELWCQTVQVKRGETYVFSAWLASAYPENPARLQFSINGQLIGGELRATSTNCDWQQFYETWQSDTTLAEICIVNINPTATGNDFLLDDLIFSPICIATDEVTVEVADLHADWTEPGAICQNEAAFALETLLAPTATAGGSWTLDGRSASAIDPGTLSPGAHELKYRVEQGACFAEQLGTITVIETPSAGQPRPAVRLCAGTDSLIALPRELLGAADGGQWTETSSRLSSGDAFDPSAASFQTAEQSPGTYTFRYEVAAPAPCSNDTATVTVILEEAPVADAGADQSLDCVVDQVQLGGANLSQGPAITYEWSGPDGAAIPGANTPFPEVGQAGIYTLTVMNTSTGCLATDQVTVQTSITTPILQVETQPVSCYDGNDGAIFIQGVEDGQPPYLFSLNGAPLTPKNQFEDLGPGNYEITVEDVNGCTNSQTVQIAQGVIPTVGLTVNKPGNPSVLPLGDSALLSIQTNIPEDRITEVIWGPDSIGCSTCLKAMVHPAKTTTYTVTILDDGGCSASAELSLLVQRRKNIFVPNAFSPNNDGINDVLMVYAGQEVAKVRSFRIHNRWGALVYDKSNFSPNDPAYGWDGRFRGRRLNSGVYLYQAELELINGKTVLLTGDVTIIH
jgi:gliding motility-associated-like protein